MQFREEEIVFTSFDGHKTGHILDSRVIIIIPRKTL
jgi:hypothetical protein